MKLRNLRDCLGVNVHQGQYIDLAIAIGVKHFRIDAGWNMINEHYGVYDFSWLDPVMTKIKAANGTAAFVCYATPARLNTSAPHIPFWQGPPAIAEMHLAWSQEFQDFLDATCDRYPWPSTIQFSVETEITLRKYWPGTPQDYIDMVLKPASEVLKPRGFQIISPGQTMQGESNHDFKHAMEITGIFVRDAEPYIDKLSTHIYRDTADDTVEDMRKFLGKKEMVLNPVTGKKRWVGIDGYAAMMWNAENPWWTHWAPFITETGFSDPDEGKRLEQFIKLFDAFESEPHILPFERFYLYQWFSGNSGIIRNDGTPTPIYEELARRLSA